MGLLEAFDRFFQDDTEDEEDSGLAEAHEIIAFANTPYYPKFMAWLEREIDKPSLLGDHMAMIVASTETNTLKKVRQTMRERVRRAVDLVERNQRG